MPSRQFPLCTTENELMLLEYLPCILSRPCIVQYLEVHSVEIDGRKVKVKMMARTTNPVQLKTDGKIPNTMDLMLINDETLISYV